MSGVEDDPRDVDEAGVVESVRHCFMQPAPHASPRPGQEPAVCGRLRYPETRRQSPPGTTADQHVEDRRKQRLIRRVLRSAALRPHLRRWDQRLGDLPQAVRNNPTPRTPPLWVPESVSPYATCEYSWIRPPSRSRRRMRVLSLAMGGSGLVSWSGGRCPRDRCGRCLLWCFAYSPMTRRRWRSPVIRMRSVVSRRHDPIQRSVMAFIRGTAGSVGTSIGGVLL